MADHLLIISEVSVSPVADEFIEIWNPTSAAVALDNYYLSNNSTDFELAQGKPWMPITNNAGTDFLGRSPKGTMIAADQVIVLALKPEYSAQYAGNAPISSWRPRPCFAAATWSPRSQPKPAASRR